MTSSIAARPLSMSPCAGSGQRQQLATASLPHSAHSIGHGLRQELRLHHRRRRLRRLRAGEPADRGPRHHACWCSRPAAGIATRGSTFRSAGASILTNRLHDWMYFTEPEPQLAGRRIECARGKVIGGSSSINAMTYSRGHRGDYDRWAAQRPADLVLRPRAAVFPQAGNLGGRRQRPSRRRRPARHALVDLRGPAGRRLHRGEPGRRACTGTTTSTAAATTASAATRTPSATAGGAARRWPICGRRWSATISRSRSTRW